MRCDAMHEVGEVVFLTARLRVAQSSPASKSVSGKGKSRDDDKGRDCKDADKGKGKVRAVAVSGSVDGHVTHRVQ